MKTINEIRATTQKEHAINMIEILINHSIANKLASVRIEASEDLPLNELVEELNLANYIIYVKYHGYVIVDLIESEIKQDNEDE